MWYNNEFFFNFRHFYVPGVLFLKQTCFSFPICYKEKIKKKYCKNIFQCIYLFLFMVKFIKK